MLTTVTQRESNTMATATENGKGVIELPRGAAVRIARRLRPKVTAQHVRMVAKRERVSPRVERAIERYLASMQHNESEAA